MKEASNIKSLLIHVQSMVDRRMIEPDYEIEIDSYVCFVQRNLDGSGMFYASKMEDLPNELQKLFLGMYLNEAHGDYKITGVYKIVV